MINIDQIKRNVGSTFFGKNIIYYPSVPSTNTSAKNLIKDKLDLPCVILSGEQTGGKGRMGRTWFSPNGLGLWMSTIFPPKTDDFDFGHYNFFISLVISETVESITGIRPDLKWPNDILISGKKFCGILSENASSPAGSIIIIGNGINLNIPKSDLPDELKEIATSLLIESGELVDIDKFIIEMITNLNAYFEIWKSQGVQPIYNEWKNRCVTIGKMVEIKTEKQYICGTADTINLDGSIAVSEKNGKCVNVYAGDLSYSIDK